jgi:hypothetical protein
MATTVDPTGPEESPTLQVTKESTGVYRVWINSTVRVRSMIAIVLILKAVLLKEMML